jgi:hypothetical protein
MRYWNLFFIFSFLYSMNAGNLYAPSLLYEGFFLSDESFANIRLGVDNDRWLDKKMKKDQTMKEVNLSEAELGAKITQAIFSVNVKERLDIYGLGGVARWSLDFDRNGSKFNGSSENGWIYTVGGKLVVLEAKDTAFGVDVKYMQSSASSAYFLENGALLSDEPKWKVKSWQISAGLSQRFAYFVPYFGITYIDAKLKLKPLTQVAERAIRIQHQLRAGIVFGTAVTTGSEFFLNLEFRAINETAVSIDAEVRF